MKINNTISRDLGLSPDVVVPAGGSIDLEESVAERLFKSPVVQAWAKDGWLVAEGSESSREQFSREEVAEMEKPKLAELLEAHRVDFDKRKGVEDLRKMLIDVMFVDV
ncbi:hypothetical protein ACSSNL_13410 [Thalassobius sp. S69A]|uniref:hypothetical protein n=1 Tax=unclassified Thalassovita TaxID=2619711 RepID=UPI003C7C28DA